MTTQAFLQARMSSSRLPGKVLTPLLGKPLFLHVFERVAQVLDPKHILIVTSSDPSDDPLCEELERRSLRFFRGPLDDVLGRFTAAWQASPSDWIIRISCDSPMISPDVIRQVAERRDDDFDLITNVFPRSFPKGQSVEILNASLFKKLASEPLLPHHREHVTQYVYENPQRFRIKNVTNPAGDQSSQSDAIDTPEELERLRAKLDRSGRV